MRTWIILLALIAPATLSACGRSRSQVRECWGNLKTIACALEMYQLDKAVDVNQVLSRWAPGSAPVPRGGGAWARPAPPDFLEHLVKEGYLQYFPTDPGAHREVRDRYWLTGWGNGLFCARHGEIQPLTHDAPPRQQLLERGIVDAATLETVSAEKPSYVPVDPWDVLLSILFFLPAVLVGSYVTFNAVLRIATLSTGAVLATAAVSPGYGGEILAMGLVLTFYVSVYLAVGALLAACLRGLARLLDPATGMRFTAMKGVIP